MALHISPKTKERYGVLHKRQCFTTTIIYNIVVVVHLSSLWPSYFLYMKTIVL